MCVLDDEMKEDEMMDKKEKRERERERESERNRE